MSRQRLTRLKKADPFSLGRDKENPEVKKYMNGDPDSWAETPYDKHLWKDEKREETGHAGEEKHNFGPSVKEAALKQAKELRAKAIKCVRIAEHLFPNASEEVLEQQGFDLMELSDRAVNATLERVAADEEVKEEEKKEEAEDEMKKEAGEMLKKAKELLAEAEAAKEEEVVEDKKEESEEAKEADEELESETPNGKLATLLLKKANSLVDASEYERELGNVKKADEMKAAAEKTLEQAKKVHAGDMSDLPPEMVESAQKLQEKEEGKEVAAPVAAPAPVVASADEKIAEANRLLEAAKKLQAEAAALSGEDGVAESTSSSSNENPSADKLPQEHPAAMEADEEVKEENKDEAQEEDCEEEADAMELDLDMVPKADDKDAAMEELFMNPDMKEAQEAYEKAFGSGDEMESEEGAKTAKSASKKGAKSLSGGIKISAVTSDADELSKLWDSPPDVSHIFK